jgi:hypothetical protein
VASFTWPEGQSAKQDFLSKARTLLLLQAEQAVAFKQVAQSEMLHVTFCNTLLLLLAVEFAVVLVVVLVVVLPDGGGATVNPGTKTIPLPGQAFLPLGQTVLLQGIRVATAYAAQVESTCSILSGSL